MSLGEATASRVPAVFGVPMFGRKVPFVALGLVIGCAPAITSGDAGRRSADIVVTSADWIDGLTLRVGNTIRVPVPVPHDGWTVVTPRRVLRLLTPPDRVEHPDPDGWRFEAIASGSAAVTFTGFVPPGSDQPNPPRFVLKVTVQ